MLNKRFLKFRYTAIRRYGEKKWSATDGVIEFNPNHTVNVSTCELEAFSYDKQKAYIVELSNGTKFFNLPSRLRLRADRGDTERRRRNR